MTRKKSCYGPAPEIRGRVHSYWLERRRIRESSRKPQASRTKQQALDKPVNLWDKAI